MQNYRQSPGGLCTWGGGLGVLYKSRGPISCRSRDRVDDRGWLVGFYTRKEERKNKL